MDKLQGKRWQIKIQNISLIALNINGQNTSIIKD